MNKFLSFRYLVICVLAISFGKACATKQQHTPINAPTVRRLEAATVPNDVALTAVDLAVQLEQLSFQVNFTGTVTAM